MRLGTRIFLCYVAILVICFSFPIKWTLDNLRIRYLEGVEDSLADQANILASWVGVQMEDKNFKTSELVEVFKGVNSRLLSAKIYSMLKT
ncbi:MAG: hypothetical protein Q7U02_14905, partial [Desulfosalsimonadaceae bacterium]|nr:hypothetical protein [Desulfosalsimonadaceae bacterium]